MLDVPLAGILGAVTAGFFAGYFASIIIIAQCIVIWSIHGQSRTRRDVSYERQLSVGESVKRLLLRLPIIFVMHPGPWLVLATLWFAYEAASGQLGPAIAWFALSFFACLAWFGVRSVRGVRQERQQAEP